MLILFRLCLEKWSRVWKSFTRLVSPFNILSIRCSDKLQRMLRKAVATALLRTLLLLIVVKYVHNLF
jgi:hypothetical protein